MNVFHFMKTEAKNDMYYNNVPNYDYEENIDFEVDALSYENFMVNEFFIEIAAPSFNYCTIFDLIAITA